MKSSRNRIILLAAVTLSIGGSAFGQHTQHQTPAQTPAPTSGAPQVGAQALSACPDNARAALETLDGLGARLEQARQTNSAADMRNAMDSVQAAVDRLRAQVSSCVAADAGTAAPSTAIDPVCARSVDALTASQATYDGQTYYFCSESDRQKFLADPAGFVKKSEPPAGAKPPAAPMDHSKMPMRGTRPAREQPQTKSPAGTDDHSRMGHGTSQTGAATSGERTGQQPPHSNTKMESPSLPVMPAEQIADPVCGKTVNRKDAPKATYQRKVYYFCSAADRDKFLKDPAAYLKKRPE